jgi:type IV pilus assembly protein PilO
MKLPRFAASTGNLRITPLHLHLAALGLLCVLNLALVTRVVLAWERVRAGDAEQLAQHQSAYQAMVLKTRPLRGLDKKILQARKDQAQFYSRRFPTSYSAIAGELGKLATQDKVLLSRVQYAQGKPQFDLAEVRMDGSLSGDYTSVAHFINDMERDKLFFVVDALALSGQQSGMVNLRIRVSTWMRLGMDADPDFGAGHPTSGAAKHSAPAAHAAHAARPAAQPAQRAQKPTPQGRL